MNREEQLKEIADNLRDRELFPESNAVAKEKLDAIGRNEQLKQAIEDWVVQNQRRVDKQSHVGLCLLVLQQSSILRYADPKIMRQAGWESSEWISCKKEIPLTYETGDWYGKRSDLVLVGDIEGKVKIGRVYEGVLDGNKFCDWYDEDDNNLMIVPYKWKKIF